MAYAVFFIDVDFTIRPAPVQNFGGSAREHRRHLPLQPKDGEGSSSDVGGRQASLSQLLSLHTREN